MALVPHESLMSLLKSTIENWFLGKKKKQLCLQKKANGGEPVSIVVHLIDREPPCTDIPHEQLIIMKGAEIFIHWISWSEAFHCTVTCREEGVWLCVCVCLRACVRACVCQCISLFPFCLNVQNKIKLSISAREMEKSFLGWQRCHRPTEEEDEKRST